MLRNTSKTKSEFPLTLSEVKTHLRLENSYTDDDTYITQLIEDATQEAENYIDADIALTTVTDLYYDYAGYYVEVQESPLIDITSVSWFDAAGNETTLTSDDYILRRGQAKFSIELDDSIDCEDGYLKLVFRTGYLSKETVPGPIKKAIRAKITDMYDVERGGCVSGAFKDSGAFERSLDYYKRRSF